MALISPIDDDASGSTDTPTSTDSTSDGTTSTDSWDYDDDGYTYQDPDEELIEASLGDGSADSADDVGGSVILAGGGATTAAGRTASGTDTEIDPSASRNVTQTAENLATEEIPVSPDEAFARAQTALEERFPNVDNVEISGTQIHPLLILAVVASAVVGYQVVEG